MNKKKKYTKAEIYKIRYAVLREQGYSASEARKLRSYSLDVSSIRIDENTKKVIKKTNFKKVVKSTSIDNEKSYLVNYMINNDTVYSDYGFIVNDENTSDRMMKLVNKIKRDNNFSDKQAWYFAYTMITQNWSYKKTKGVMISNEQFEMYKKR